MPADVVDRPISRTPAPPRSGRTAPALDLHKGIATKQPRETPTGCPRWPDGMWLLAKQTGEVVPGRCRATNQCAYCARLAAVENAEVLALDAVLGQAPIVWMVLTSRSTELNPAAFRLSRQLLVRALRDSWPGLEFAWLWELTTGYGTRSGGKRRLHGNVLLKIPVRCAQDGTPKAPAREERTAPLKPGEKPPGEPESARVYPEILAQLSEIVERHWCRREDAHMAGQHVGEIANAGGLMRYLALHFQKESQAPPKGWRGHRFQTSRGYLWRPTPVARQEARESLRFKRELWRAEQAGISGEQIVDVAQAAVDRAKKLSWRLAYTNPAGEIRPGDIPPRAGISDARRRELLEEHYLREFAAVRAEQLQ